MTLSYRQREFLGRLLDLYHESKHAVHYTDLAQSLGVKPVTAYEMLRLLEKRKGWRSLSWRVPQGNAVVPSCFSPPRRRRWRCWPAGAAIGLTSTNGNGRKPTSWRPWSRENPPTTRTC